MAKDMFITWENDAEHCIIDLRKYIQLAICGDKIVGLTFIVQRLQIFLDVVSLDCSNVDNAHLFLMCWHNVT